MELLPFQGTYIVAITIPGSILGYKVPCDHVDCCLRLAVQLRQVNVDGADFARVEACKWDPNANSYKAFALIPR